MNKKFSDFIAAHYTTLSLADILGAKTKRQLSRTIIKENNNKKKMSGQPMNRYRQITKIRK